MKTTIQDLQENYEKQISELKEELTKVLETSLYAQGKLKVHPKIENLKSQISELKELLIKDSSSREISLEVHNQELTKSLNDTRDRNRELELMLEKYDIREFAKWMIKNGYCDTDIIDESGVDEYLKEIK